MENYQTCSHSRYDIKYHFVWITKYRKQVLTGAVSTRARDLVRAICRTHDIDILEGAVSRDHVHVLLSCPPNISLSKIMQYIKGKTSHKLIFGIQAYTKTVLGSAPLGRGYYVASSGNVIDEVNMEYIRLQDSPEMQVEIFKLLNRERRTSVRSSRYSRTYRLQPVVV